MSYAIELLCDADWCNKTGMPRMSIQEARYLNREVSINEKLPDQDARQLRE